MDELINISDYCSTLLIKYGNELHSCNAVYNKEENCIEFRIIYNYIDVHRFDSWQYSIQDFNFMLTKTHVLVNSDTIDMINDEVEKRLNVKTVVYGQEEKREI